MRMAAGIVATLLGVGLLLPFVIPFVLWATSQVVIATTPTTIIKVAILAVVGLLVLGVGILQIGIAKRDRR